MGWLTGVQSWFALGRVNLRERYEFLQASTSGTMSEVHKARDRRTGRLVAVKVLDREKTAAFEARFPKGKKPNEGQIGLRLKHPRLVETLEYGLSSEDEPFVVLEFLEGQNLGTLLHQKSSLLAGRKLLLARQAAAALSAVHRAGFLHRDICPHNFIVAPDGNSLKLIDFGLTLPNRAEFLQPGNRTGKPDYMAPELLRRQPITAQVDVFAFGVTVFELCTGQLPWKGGTGREAAARMTVAPPDPRLLVPQLAAPLARAIQAAFQPEPAQRCPNLDDFLRRIQPLTSETDDAV